MVISQANGPKCRDCIGSGLAPTMVAVRLLLKFAGVTLYEGRMDYLPVKDYETDPLSQKEIHDREVVIAKMIQENPDRVHRVGGVETVDDLAKLIGGVVEKLSGQNEL